MEDLITALHIHTLYSDGNGTHLDLVNAGLKTDLDVLIATDHNVLVQEVDCYHKKGKKKLLLLVGEEIHDQSSEKGRNHLLIFGHSQELARFAPDRQQLINQANLSGGLTFIAHPIDDPLLKFGEESFNWEDWGVSGFTGIELWNQMSEFKTRSQTVFGALLNSLVPHLMTIGPLERTLKLWDDLSLKNGQSIVAVAGVDAHALKKHAGPLNVELYPYEFQFRSLRTHVLTPSGLTGELSHDRRMVINAIRKGHCYCAYDLPHLSSGFRFTCNTNEGTYWMGDKVSAKSGLTFQVRLPKRSHIRLIKDGKVIKEHTDREVLTHITKEPGIYRSEAYIDYLGRHVGWIFSNPIYASF